MDIDFTLTTLWLCVLLLLMDIKMYFELLLYMSSCLPCCATACKIGGGCFINIKTKRENLLLRVFSGWFNFIQDENYGYVGPWHVSSVRTSFEENYMRVSLE